MKGKKFLWILFLFFSGHLISQEFNLSNIGTKEGLPSSETYESFQDSKGYIWISTDAGLCRYNGQKIQTFTTNDGISENVIFWIREDVKERVWFCSLSGFFFYFDYADNKFHQIAANPELKKICGRYLIHSFYIGENDTLYCFAASHYGIIKVAPQSNYKNILVTESTAYDRWIYRNPVNKEEFVTLFNNNNNNNRANKDSFSYYYDKKIIRGNIKYDPAPMSINNVAFTRCDQHHNLYLFDHSTLIIYNEITGEINYHKFPAQLNTLKIDPEDNLWISIGYEGGLFYKNGNLSSPPIEFLKGTYISNFMFDREGTVWINTLQKGIFKILNKNILNIPLAEDHAVDIYRNSSELHIGLASQKEIIIKKQDDKIFIETYKNNLPDKQELRSFVATPDYSIYSTSSSLYYIKNNVVSEILENGKRNMYSAKKIIAVNKDSTIVVCPTGAIFYLHKNQVAKKHILEFEINTLIQLHDGRLIAGTRNTNGLFELNEEGQLIPFLDEIKDLKARINDIREDANSNLWIATNEKGLFTYSNGKLRNFNQKTGLISDKINTIDIDEAGRVWAGSSSGISCITHTDSGLKIFNFDESSGIPNLEIQKISAFKGYIWCATKTTFFYFNENKLIPNYISPLIRIYSILVNNNEILLKRKNDFKYDQNNFEIKFDGLTFKNTEDKQFLYQLEGFDTTWYSSGTGKLQYTNLPPGAYTFKVYALNNDKIKSQQPATFTFIIQKPFWWRWWFLTLLFCFIVTVILLVIRWRVNKIKRRESLKTQFNQKLAEFHLTAVRAQMNPHFLFNAISSIQHYILENDVYKSYDYLSKFSLLIRNVLETSEKEYIVISKEISTLRLYIELEQIRFEKPFNYNITIEGGLDVESTFIPTVLIQPYVENAIWHGLMPKKDQGELKIIFKKLSDISMEVIIRDNGVGRHLKKTDDYKKAHESKGMNLTKQRLLALGIKTSEKFFEEITDIKDSNGNPAGTEVKLSMPLITNQI